MILALHHRYQSRTQQALCVYTHNLALCPPPTRPPQRIADIKTRMEGQTKIEEAYVDTLQPITPLMGLFKQLPKFQVPTSHSF